MPIDQVEQLHKQAKEAIAHGDYREARQLFQQALGARSDSPDIHYGMATVAFLLGDLHSAVYHFKEVTRLDPLRAGALINLGAVYNRLGQYDDALTTLRRGIKLDANRAEGYYNLALVYKQLNQLDMAINAYREAIRINPRMYDAHFNMANIYLEKERFAAAIEHYRQALEIRPNWEKGRQALAAAEEAQEAKGLATATAHHAAPAALPESDLDPNRPLDLNVHGALLRELHPLVIEAENQGQAMHDFLLKEVDSAIRDLSIAMLDPKNPKFNLDEQIRRIDTAVNQLHDLEKAMQKCVADAKHLSEQIAEL